MLKRLIMLLSLCFIMVSAVYAQAEADSVYTFRFKAGDDMFYTPWSGNEMELERLEQCVEKYKNPIIDGSMPLRVNGYCTTGSDEAGCLRIAAIRSNRVKSELIMRCGLREECFITRNHASDGEYVTVQMVVPADASDETPDTQPEEAVESTDEQPASQEPAEVQQPVETDTTDVAEPAPQPDEQPSPAESETEKSDENSQLSIVNRQSSIDNHSLSLRANLLRWATLTPDIGVEWRIGSRVGVVVEGTYTSWSWNNADRRYALWEVAPEVRYYLGRECRGYVGAMFKAGGFNYKLSETGKQGDLIGGGITGGYVLRLNNALSLDFSLGIGCLHADYDRYVTIDGVRVGRGSETKNWWGPISAGVTLVWTLF